MLSFFNHPSIGRRSLLFNFIGFPDCSAFSPFLSFFKHFYTEDFSQGVMVSCNGFFFLMLSVVKCRQITSTVINYHVGWTISRYVT